LNIPAAPRAARTLVLTLWLLAAPAAALAPAIARLDFQVQEGLNLNRLVREGEVAAHLLLRSGSDPRILIAFPAGNSGVGLWFVHLPAKASWTLRAPPRTVRERDDKGRPLYGIAAEVSDCSGAEIDFTEIAN